MMDNAQGFAAGGDISPALKTLFSPKSTSTQAILPAAEFPYLVLVTGLTGAQKVTVSQMLTYAYTRTAGSGSSQFTETVSQQTGPYLPNAATVALSVQRTILALPAGVEYQLDLTPAALGTAVVTAILYRGKAALPAGLFFPPSIGGGAVTSVAGRIGDVTLVPADVSLGNVDNVSDANKPVSTAQATADTAVATAASSALGAHASAANPHSGSAPKGAVGASGLTMTTARLLGRSTTATGAVEEITLGTNLSFAGTTLNATGGGTGDFKADGSVAMTGALQTNGVMLGSANQLEQRNGTNAQKWCIYNTYTDVSNYEAGVFRWVSNALEIATTNAGTGANRNMYLRQPQNTAGSWEYGPSWLRYVVSAEPNYGVRLLGDNGSGHSSVDLGSGGAVRWGSSQYTHLGSLDTSLYRGAAGRIDVCTTGPGVYGDLKLANLTATGVTVTTTAGAGSTPLTITDSSGSAHSLKFHPYEASIESVFLGEWGTTFKFNNGGFSVVDSGNTGNMLFKYDLFGLHAKKITSSDIAGATYNTLTLTSNYYGVSTVTPAIKFTVHDTAGSTDQLAKVEIFNGDSGHVVMQRTGGNVGIGMTPAQKLDVTGNIQSTGYQRTAPVTVATLTAAATAGAGARHAVTDSTVATTGNVGSTVVGGGANTVSVFCTGAAWIIG